MEKDDLEKNIRDYLYFAEFGENKSINTIVSLKKDLSQLSEYLLGMEKVSYSEDITSVMLRGFNISSRT